MKYITLFFTLLAGLVMSGCAGQLDQVKQLNAQNHKVNVIERDITQERAKQVAFAASIAVAEDGIKTSEAEQERLTVELEKEKATLLELVK